MIYDIYCHMNGMNKMQKIFKRGRLFINALYQLGEECHFEVGFNK